MLPIVKRNSARQKASDGCTVGRDAASLFITIKGTPGCEIAKGLPVAPSDPIIVKKRYSAFYGTKLEDLLAELQPDALVLAGINTHACIRTTAMDAYQRDWPLIIASDCVSSYDEEHHAITLRYLQREIASAMTNQEIDLALVAGTRDQPLPLAP